MKKTTITLGFLLVTLITFNQTWIEFVPSESTRPNVNLLHSDSLMVAFNVVVPGIYDSQVDTFNRIEIPGHVRMDSAGYPELPILNYLVATPICENINLEIIPLDSVILSEMNIYPAPELVEVTPPEGYTYLEEQFIYNETVYQSDKWMTESFGNLSEIGALRAQHCARVNLYPIKFNPVKKQVIVYTEIRINLTFVNSNGPVNEDVGIFNEVAGNTMINYVSNGLNVSISAGNGINNPGNLDDFWVTSFHEDDYIEEPCDYLIITNEQFYQNPHLESLAEHRSLFNGYDVVIVKTSDIYTQIQGNNFTQQIRNLIRNTYNFGTSNNTYDGKLAYVNLFGDHKFGSSALICVPTAPHNIPEGHDDYYTRLTENPSGEPDNIPDIMLGRISADTDDQIYNYVNKIENFDPQSEDWLDDMIFFVGRDNSGGGYEEAYDCMLISDEIVGEDMTLTFTVPSNFYFDPILNWIQLPDHTLAEFLTDYEGGNLFLNYMGHGGSDCFYQYGGDFLFHFSDLITNSPPYNFDNKFPFIIASACHTGEFHLYNECMAEQFIIEDPNIGAIGFVGANYAAPMSNNKILSSSIINSTYNNYSYTIGESVMETKILHSGFRDNFNLFGDPALNILYENYEFTEPDLLVKENDIIFEEGYFSIGDNINITARVRNYSPIGFNEQFAIACYLGDPQNPNSDLLGINYVTGMDPYSLEETFFTWNTNAYISDYYDIYIVVDSDNEIDEFNENNNDNHKQIALYQFQDGFPVTMNYDKNSRLISFDIYSNNESEIIIGDNIYSNSGQILYQGNNQTTGFTSIGNLYSNELYQMIEFADEDNIKKVICPIHNDEWHDYILPESKNAGPLVDDINNDGNEEVLIANMSFDALLNGHQALICLKNDGTEKWIFDGFNVISPPHGSGEVTSPNFKPISCTIENDHLKTIVLIINNGIIYLVQENPDGNGAHITNEFTITNFSGFISDPIATDMNKDNKIEVILVYYDFENNKCLGFFQLSTSGLSFNSIALDNSKKYSDPIFSDTDNDGISEIMLASLNYGITVFDYMLNQVNDISISGLYPYELSTGDFNNDNSLDIVCFIVDDDYRNYLRIIGLDEQTIYCTPVPYINIKMWNKDIDSDFDIEIIYSRLNELYVTDVPLEGNIFWPGNPGNKRCTGIIEQPAFHGGQGKTVYWTENISVSGHFEIPENSTVIIKPGTIISAHDESSIDVYGKLYAEGNESHPIIIKANSNNIEAGYWQGITLKNHSEGYFKYCEISDAEIAILAEDKNKTDIRKCTFENNIVGIGASNSSPFVKNNIIINNEIGIGSYNNGSPILADLIHEQPFRNGIINNALGIELDGSSIYLDYGYNDIFSGPAIGYYIAFINEPGPDQLKARKNYWGSTNISEILQHLNPSTAFLIEPICTSSQSSYTPPEDDESQMMQSGSNSMLIGDYESAETTFKNIIEQYPETLEAYLSVSLIFECTEKSSGNFESLENYYIQLRQDTTINEELEKVVFGYLNLCKRELGKFDEAISNYESIIINDPSYNDSVYAVIDIGNTYEEAGNYKSTLGQLSYLVPVSRAKHVEKTVDLLLSLRPDNNNDNRQLKNEFYITDIIPNPFRNETTIYYEIPYSSNISIKVFDVNGKLIQSETLRSTTEGNNKHVLQMPKATSGVYYVALEANGRQVEVKKVVVN